MPIPKNYAHVHASSWFVGVGVGMGTGMEAGTHMGM